MNGFIGKWKIIEMEQWNQHYIDLVEPGYIELSNNGLGAFVFGTVNGFIDYRTSKENEEEIIEFSWDGTSEYDPICGRGKLEFKDTNTIHGRLFIHNGDDSWLVAIKE